MKVAELETTILETARDLYEKGPGYAQQSVVLREVAEQIHPKSVSEEQAILSAWHMLFQKGVLAWGYNLDTPGPPWYHLPVAKNS
ncbi:MAG TPA: hypothetical protein VMM76_18325 [Pirellulaceae bacterium]|nr:hypothetical protein [Pirellulaceae bacterium]